MGMDDECEHGSHHAGEHMIVGTDYQHDIGSDLLQEIILDDVYGIRGLDHGRVQYVLDVGANIGFFAVMARMLYPRAKIIAVEPIPATLDILRQNIAELDIAVDTCALGTGQPMYMKSMDDTDHTLHRVTTTPASGVVVPTKTLNT
ncbi:MAG: FkbM family methyltransferase, partial [Myxococcales bacterium]|nr:FkbM family methyltransferase [Myxococcales bacterium]